MGISGCRKHGFNGMGNGGPHACNSVPWMQICPANAHPDVFQGKKTRQGGLLKI